MDQRVVIKRLVKVYLRKAGKLHAAFVDFGKHMIGSMRKHSGRF